MRLIERSGTWLAAAIREGEVTAGEVLEAHLEHIERVNPIVHAIVADRFSDARAEAAAADERVRAAGAGDPLPPLLGVPITVKESIGVERMPNSAGIVARRDHRCEADAVTVRRLREAGAIVLGVTNTSELTMWIESHNRLYGRTHSAYDEQRTAGGSSGGEGASIGSGLAPIGLGTDIGGSIRLPAFFNGVFGHKPTWGLVPNTGSWPMTRGDAGRMLGTGPLTRRAEDLLPVLRLIAGPDGEDELVREWPVGDVADVAFDGLRVLLSYDASVFRTERALHAARERASGALAAAGAHVEDVSLKDLRRAMELYLIALSEGAGVTSIEVLADAGVEVRWHQALRLRNPHTIATWLLFAAERVGQLSPRWHKRRVMAAIKSLTAEVEATIGDAILLHPPHGRIAPRHGRTVGRPWVLHQTAVFNLLGFPATAVPMGLTEENVPTGVQVVAAPGRDHATIAVACELERVFGGWVPPWEVGAPRRAPVLRRRLTGLKRRFWPEPAAPARAPG
jgi:fatty acid amide hydrolase 2